MPNSMSLRRQGDLLISLRQRTALPAGDPRRITWGSSPAEGYFAVVDDVRIVLNGATGTLIASDLHGAERYRIVPQNIRGGVILEAGLLGAAVEPVMVRLNAKWRVGFHLHQVYVDAQGQWLRRPRGPSTPTL